jgi:thiamine-phosphate pyrophosphorylase
MLRLMDANLDRLGEGLRVLEDSARFVLGDIQITETLKRMRHELTSTDPAFRSKLLASRDSEEDIGREKEVATIPRSQLVDLIAANARRAQESLRVLEEYAKLPQVPTEIAERNFEKARFALYDIEKELTLKLIRHDKRERISGVYIIIDGQNLVGRSEVLAAREVIKGGAGIIQLRDKLRNKGEILDVAYEIKKICAEAGVLFVLNDHVDVAMAVDADGVHLGKDDLPVSLARDMMVWDKIVGCTVRTVDQAVRAQEEGVDYVGVGSIYPSPTKPDVEIVGPERLQEIRGKVSIPIVAIGGINVTNISEVIEIGADSVAAINAVFGADDPLISTQQLVRKFNLEVSID